MENHIDFPAVRASIKAQIQARLMARMGGHTEDGVGVGWRWQCGH